MATEKDIRKFINDNRIPVPKDDRFMADLIRQIDLLPTPASLEGREEDTRQENIRLVRQIMEALRRRYRREALNTILCSVSICLAAVLCVIFLVGPETSASSAAQQSLASLPYLLLGIFSLAVLALTLSRTDFFRM